MCCPCSAIVVVRIHSHIRRRQNILSNCAARRPKKSAHLPANAESSISQTAIGIHSACREPTQMSVRRPPPLAPGAPPHGMTGQSAPVSHLSFELPAYAVRGAQLSASNRNEFRRARRKIIIRQVRNDHSHYRGPNFGRFQQACRLRVHRGPYPKQEPLHSSTS